MYIYIYVFDRICMYIRIFDMMPYCNLVHWNILIDPAETPGQALEPGFMGPEWIPASPAPPKKIEVNNLPLVH
jgi:hypothetical protein